ncbi:MAG: CPCC family cysteine-rich protein [Woeseiaceae bacterium]|nr:CPCC family cysteine-rich protein [Woeseiaceae bacterium]
MTDVVHPCPCCGFIVFTDLQGWEICPICFWEDDPIQLCDPWYEGGANTLSLVQSQKNFVELGAMERRFLKHVRAPRDSDRRDPKWRPVRKEDRAFATTPAALFDQAGTDAIYEYWLRGGG